MDIAQKFSTQTPFLLMPVRIETRFKEIDNSNHELWVRVYPDQWAVDTFEPELSDVEIESAREYWVNVWRAGRFPEQEKAAWRTLVASHGSGRAAWMIKSEENPDRYQPANSNSAKYAENDVVLVIVIEGEAVDPIQEQALAEYWKIAWFADGDLERTQNAFDFASSLYPFVVPAELLRQLIETYPPINFSERPPFSIKKNDINAEVAFLRFPVLPDRQVKPTSWTQSAQINVLPEHFVLQTYSKDQQQPKEYKGSPIPDSLIVGPDPKHQRTPGDTDAMPEEMKWMSDFQVAIDSGMGFKVPLTQDEWDNGFDKLLVLGVTKTNSLQENKSKLEQLIQHHHYGHSGFGLLPQGTPTNNTESVSAGFSYKEDADTSYELYFETEQFSRASDPFAKQDGQWLAEMLGVDSDILKHVSHSRGFDQREAKAMNMALWPATWGYALETMLHPVLKQQDVDNVRLFFTQYVSGRGMLPTIRVGKQPYGILATTAYSKLAEGNWFEQNGDDFASKAFMQSLSKLNLILANPLGQFWAGQVGDVSKVKSDQNSQRSLLDVLSLHATSVSSSQQYLISLQQLFTRIYYELVRSNATLKNEMLIRFTEWADAWLKEEYHLLKAIGDRINAYPSEPDILSKLYQGSITPLDGQLIDDYPLSETFSIRGYATEISNNKSQNYIEWLQTSSLENIRLFEGLNQSISSRPLLFILLRHSLLLGYWDTAIRLLKTNASSEKEKLGVAAARREFNFIHVEPDLPEINPEIDPIPESRWAYLYEKDDRNIPVTGDRSVTIGSYIESHLQSQPEAAFLRQQLRALEILKDLPTARLERTLAEHIDCCSYRLDAWKTGLVNYQLASMRKLENSTDEAANATQGIYLGAYGWLKDVRRKEEKLTPPDLSSELKEIFSQSKESPILQDATNAGYIHAPSLNQAVTAAILRNGYLSNATPEHPDALAVNLSSERVRLALSVLEGIRKGQSLGALLGYQLERGLHDRHSVEIDKFIFVLREAFPLRANRLKSTEEPDTPIQKIEARNVVDGLRLIEYVKNDSERSYPFGHPVLSKADASDSASSAQKAAIDAEVEKILDIHDAIADLAISESVHQAVQGNYDRAAANLDAFSKGGYPPEPEIIRTPRSGVTLTHRVALHLTPSANPSVSPIPQMPITPRAQSEPTLNDWLSTVLPAPANVVCRVTAESPMTNEKVDYTVTQADLKLQPIDLIYIMQGEGEELLVDLDDYILRQMMTLNLRPDTAFAIQHLVPTPDKVTFFELAPLIQNLRSLILNSRILEPQDLTLQNEAANSSTASIAIDITRFQQLNLDGIRRELESFLSTLNQDNANHAVALSKIDQHIESLINFLVQAKQFGIPQTSWRFAYEWKKQTYQKAVGTVQELSDRWDSVLQRADELLAEYEEIDSEEDIDDYRWELLQRIERLVSTKSIYPLPDGLTDMKKHVAKKRESMDDKLDLFKNILNSTQLSLFELLESIKSQLPITEFDLQEPSVDEIEASILDFLKNAEENVNSLVTSFKERHDKLTNNIEEYKALIDSKQRVKISEKTAKSIFGEDFKVIPIFDTPSGYQPSIEAPYKNIQDAYSAREKLLAHFEQENPLVDFPLDDWLYGISRVREKMHQWEQTAILSEALGRKDELQLEALQFPYKDGDTWLGLAFPESQKPNRDHLLYTVHNFDPSLKQQCGLLLDEWTEDIPNSEETTGITFNYDQPNCEPPQTMLLVTPPEARDHWEWDDLVQTLNDTLEMAKTRAVEPAHLQNTPYARLLPATFIASATHQISIFSDLAENNPSEQEN